MIENPDVGAVTPAGFLSTRKARRLAEAAAQRDVNESHSRGGEYGQPVADAYYHDLDHSSSVPSSPVMSESQTARLEPFALPTGAGRRSGTGRVPVPPTSPSVSRRTRHPESLVEGMHAPTPRPQPTPVTHRAADGFMVSSPAEIAAAEVMRPALAQPRSRREMRLAAAAQNAQVHDQQDTRVVRMSVGSQQPARDISPVASFDEGETHETTAISAPVANALPSRRSRREAREHEVAQSFESEATKAEVNHVDAAPAVEEPREFGDDPRGVAAPINGHWIPKIALLTGIAGVTVALPLSGVLGAPQSGADASDGTLSASGDLTDGVAMLSQVTESTSVPVALQSNTDREVSAQADRASRADFRSPLAGCDGVKRVNGTNGALPDSDLCTLWEGGYKIRADAAVALAELNEAYKARFGSQMCLSSGYRTLGEQASLRATKGGIAARPGQSNHGLGLAVDLGCGINNYGTAQYSWMRENAPKFGWDNPEWARQGGSGANEPWHWEFDDGSGERLNTSD